MMYEKPAYIVSVYCRNIRIMVYDSPKGENPETLIEFYLTSSTNTERYCVVYRRTLR